MFAVGKILGDNKYKLLESLGSGTYGEVWLAEDVGLKRRLAIKGLHPHMGRLNDLVKEATTQARLTHPNIATIYEVDVNQRFIAMEYVEGDSLETYLKQHIVQETWPDFSNEE